MSPSTPLITEGSAEHSTIASSPEKRREIPRLAHVAADELDPGLLQPRQVELRAAPVEVVERDDLPLGVPCGQRDGEVGADEAGATGKEQAVQGRRRYQQATASPPQPETIPRVDPGPCQEIADLRCEPGELSFEARIGGRAQQLWLRTETEVTPAPEAALAACLMPAMRFGGSLSVPEPLSARLLRNQREFQAIQHAWSLDWPIDDPPLQEVEVLASSRAAEPETPSGRVAALFSGGVDSWSTVLDHPEITDLIFVRGFDLLAGSTHAPELVDLAEERTRWAADELGLALHVVETNLRELSDPLNRWEACYGCAAAAVALFFEPLFERVLIAGEADYEVQVPIGSNRLVDRLWSTERLEIADDGGRYSRVQRTARIAGHPVVQQTLRVCWENRDGAYNCGRCRKCLTTMIALEALGARREVVTFPPELDLDAVAAIEIPTPVLLSFWEDLLDATRAANRPDLERPVEAVVTRGRRDLGLPSHYRRRALPGPPPTVRIAVIVTVWRQAQYMAAAVRSALNQEIGTGVGVVIVNDGCPQPQTDRISRLLRDADPERVSYIHQENAGPSAARNAGIRRAVSRWPHVEAFFMLDGDNVLSPHTLAHLWETLERRPDAAWATPTLELFGSESGSWSLPEPYLLYRQLFTNQSDTGSLIRRSVFEAGIAFDEGIRGFEDWDLFLRASLTGFRGAQAGRCGFRYRRLEGSLLARAQSGTESLAVEMRERHPAAFAPGALSRYEHLEAPRFGLVRCDAEDVLLTAACDLEPHRMPMSEFLRPRGRADRASPLAAHVPAIAVLGTVATFDWLQAKGVLAQALLRLQVGLREHAVVGLRVSRRPTRLVGRRQGEEPSRPVALALRTRTLAELAPIGVHEPQEMVEIDGGRGKLPTPLTETLLEAATARMATALRPNQPLIADGSHAQYFESMHVDLLETTLPSTEASAGVEAVEWAMLA